MKAILILDEMPKSCEECHLRLALDIYRCINTKENRLRWCGDEDGFYTSDTKPSWCPLRPLPTECSDSTKIYNAHGEIDCYQLTEYARGWNDCLDEIEGETE